MKNFLEEFKRLDLCFLNGASQKVIHTIVLPCGKRKRIESKKGEMIL